MKKIIVIPLFVLLSTGLFSQTRYSRDNKTAKNSINVELGGVGKAMYSVNYDRIITSSSDLNLLVKAGVAFPSTESDDAFKDDLVYPVEISVLSDRLELGMGQIINPKQEILTSTAPPYLRFGLRYQNDEGGLMMRLSLVSNLLKKEYKPWIGLTIGYSFGINSNK